MENNFQVDTLNSTTFTLMDVKLQKLGFKLSEFYVKYAELLIHMNLEFGLR